MPNTTTHRGVRRFLRFFERLLRLVLLALATIEKLRDLFE